VDKYSERDSLQNDSQRARNAGAMMSRITTTKGRERAFLIRTYRRKYCQKGTWHVGITTSKYFWLDLETPYYWRARYIAMEYAKRLETDISLYQTNKSFWIVSWKPLSKNEWNGCYRHAMARFKDAVCIPFCECCLKYGKATLRVDSKNGHPPPTRLEVISGLSKRGKTSFARNPESGVGASPNKYPRQETKIPRAVESRGMRTTDRRGGCC